MIITMVDPGNNMAISFNLHDYNVMKQTFKK